MLNLSYDSFLFWLSFFSEIKTIYAKRDMTVAKFQINNKNLFGGIFVNEPWNEH